MPVCLSYSTSGQTSCWWLGKAAEDDPKPWAPAPCGSPGRSSWHRLWIDLAPVIATAWGMNQRVKDLPLCIFSSLYICFSNENKENFKKKKEEKRRKRTERKKKLLAVSLQEDKTQQRAAKHEHYKYQPWHLCQPSHPGSELHTALCRASCSQHPSTPKQRAS